MIKRILIYVLPVLFILMIVSCIFPPEDDYVELKLVDYFTLSYESMAKKLARQLDVMPITYNGTTYFSFMGDDNHLTPYTGHQWIKEGHEYITSDSALIIVWTDNSIEFLTSKICCIIIFYIYLTNLPRIITYHIMNIINFYFLTEECSL